MTEHIKSPNDMRRELQRLAAGLRPLDAPHSADLTSSIVRTCLQAGLHEGWSGEDTYVVLAWQLLQVANRWGRMVYEQELLRVHPPIILASGFISQPMETAPKDRTILLCMPELGKVWAPGWWRGGWSFAENAWGIHLPMALEGKGGVASLVNGAPQPTGWMEMPPCP